jgi:hypothetical protein
MLLTDNDIKAELSYAYLHAVSAKAGFGCECAGRQSDNAGIDARVVLKERLDPSSILTNFTINVQLKATSQQPVLENDRYSYFLHDVAKYDELRERSGSFPTLLVVVFLPEDASLWLQWSEEALIARRCAYWTSRWDAPETKNRSGQTVYLPRSNRLTPDSLRAVARRLSMQEDVLYAG